jgi:hypothetical protein
MHRMILPQPFRLLLALVVLAGLGLSSQHRLPSLYDSWQQSFLLWGGSLSDLCDSEGNLPHLNHAQDCSLCHIAAQAVLPPRAGSLRAIERRFIATVIAPRENRAAHRARDPLRNPRAPPLPA